MGNRERKEEADVGVLGSSLGGTGGGPFGVDTLRLLPFRPRIDRLEKSGIEGRPMLNDDDLPEKLESVGDEALSEESRLMGLLVDREESGSTGERAGERDRER